MSKKNLTTLLKKRARLEAEIAAAEVAEKRKSDVLDMQEFVKISHLPDAILRESFSRIAAENASQN